MAQAQTVSYNKLDVTDLTTMEVKELIKDINQLQDFRVLISYLINNHGLKGSETANFNAFVESISNPYKFSYEKEYGRSAEFHLKGIEATILFTENSSRSIIGAMIEREVDGNYYVEAYDVINGTVYHTSTMEVYEEETRPGNLRSDSLYVIETNEGSIHYHESPFLAQAKLTDSVSKGCNQEDSFSIQSSCTTCNNICAWVVPSITCSISSYAYCS